LPGGISHSDELQDGVVQFRQAKTIERTLVNAEKVQGTKGGYEGWSDETTREPGPQDGGAAR